MERDIGPGLRRVEAFVRGAARRDVYNGRLAGERYRRGETTAIAFLASVAVIASLVLGGRASASATDTGALTVGALQPFPNPVYSGSISCVDGHTCYAVGSERRLRGPSDLFTLSDGTVTGEQQLPGFMDAVACLPDGTCYATGNAFVATVHPAPNPALLVTIANGIPGPEQDIDGAGTLRGIACAESGSCYAVGDSADPDATGVIVPIHDGAVGQAQSVPGTWSLWDIDCPTANSCYAAGTSHDGGSAIVTVVDGQPGAVQPVTGILFDAIACPSAQICYAVGPLVTPDGPSGGAVVAIEDGIAGPVQTVAGANWLAAVACPTTSTCLAFGDTTPPATAAPTGTLGQVAAPGVVVPLMAGVAGGAITVESGSLGSGDCPTSQTCYALTGAGVVPITYR